MDQILHLLTEYKAFTESAHSEDFALFGEWLKQRHGVPAGYVSDEPEVDAAGPEIIAAYLLGGIASYVEVWVKRCYEDLPVRSLGDYGILKAVEYYRAPSKKDIAGEVIMERSTCIESIRRLQREGLLAEAPDESDRRIRRVTLTPAGTALIAVLDGRMKRLGALLMGGLDELEKQSLIPALKKLNRFHDALYRKQDAVDVKELYGI